LGRKGAKLVDAANEKLTEPTVCREIGGLLGNDLGQMRLQFNARAYLVEPAYRHDNLGLWDFGPQPDAPVEEIEVAAESVRVEQRETDYGRITESPGKQGQTAKSMGVAENDGCSVATYPEWDNAQGRLRSDWVTILEIEPERKSVPETPSFQRDTIVRKITARRVGRAEAAQEEPKRRR
jgi:nitric oxide reductase NorD protein